MLIPMFFNAREERDKIYQVIKTELMALGVPSSSFKDEYSDEYPV